MAATLVAINTAVTSAVLNGSSSGEVSGTAFLIIVLLVFCYIAWLIHKL